MPTEITSARGLDFSKAPYNLSADQIDLVEQTLSQMSLASKVGQMMCIYFVGDDVAGWTERMEASKIEPGAIMLLGQDRSSAPRNVSHLQDWSRIPLLVAGNLEAGADTVLSDLTAFASPMQIGASTSPLWADRLGRYCARVARDIGLNWAFAPVVDIVFSPKNPIINTRAFGSDPELVANMGEAYVRAMESRGIATSVKHFPGDGVDDRDQHLVATTNSLTVDDWNRSFGNVYRRMVAAGASTVMVGHIRQPAYTRELAPGIEDRDILPGSLSTELIEGLLRQTLGFDGLVVSDSSSMAGITSIFERGEGLTRAVLAGCDVILGTVDTEDDFQKLLQSAECGAIPIERIDQAVRRVLALKASLGLLDGRTSATRDSEREPTNAVEESEWRRELAGESATLVKDTASLLPLNSSRDRRTLVYVLGDEETFYNPAAGLSDRFVHLLRQRGLAVETRQIPGVAQSLEAAAKFHEGFDLCIYFANQKYLGNTNTLRVQWTPPRGPDAPRHVATLPTLLVSIADPFMLQDMPMIRTAVNGYTPTIDVVDAIVERLFGDAPFVGVSPVDPFAGYWDARL